MNSLLHICLDTSRTQLVKMKLTHVASEHPLGCSHNETVGIYQHSLSGKVECDTWVSASMRGTDTIVLVCNTLQVSLTDTTGLARRGRKFCLILGPLWSCMCRRRGPQHLR